MTSSASKRRESGQVLLIAALLLVLIALILPMLFFQRTSATKNAVVATKSDRALTVAEEGISHALQILSASQATWNAARNGTFPTDCQSGAPVVTSSSGGSFELRCFTVDPDRLTVRVESTAILLDAHGASSRLTRLQAIISPMTLGAVTPSGVIANAAVELANVPSVPNNKFEVHWGPVVQYSIATWTLLDPMDQEAKNGIPFQGFPRKFSNGAITGANYARVPATPGNTTLTDQKEYWAYASLSQAKTLDENYYRSQAQDHDWGISPMPTPGGAGCMGPVQRVCGAGAPGNTCGYFTVQSGCSADFSNVTAASPNAVIFIDGNGNASFKGLDLDLKNGAIYVKRNLVLDTPAGGSNYNGANALNVPENAAADYYYWEQAKAAGVTADWPCRANAGSTCNSGGSGAGLPHVNFRGFLYAGGDTIVSNGAHYVLVGAARFGSPERTPAIGTLTIPSGGQLTVMYDESVAQKIVTESGAGRIQLTIERLRRLAG